MFQYLTSVTAYLGMVIALWLAAYLLARGFPSRVTLRAVIVMALLAAYFYSAYLTAVTPTFTSTVFRAVTVVWGLIVWYDLTDKLVPPNARGRPPLLVPVFYVLAAAATALLISQRDAVIAVSLNPTQ